MPGISEEDRRFWLVGLVILVLRSLEGLE